jgi:hypothetical protein
MIGVKGGFLANQCAPAGGRFGHQTECDGDPGEGKGEQRDHADRPDPGSGTGGGPEADEQGDTNHKGDADQRADQASEDLSGQHRGGEIAMVRKRTIIPSVISMQRFTAVVALGIGQGAHWRLPFRVSGRPVRAKKTSSRTSFKSITLLTRLQMPWRRTRTGLRLGPANLARVFPAACPVDNLRRYAATRSATPATVVRAPPDVAYS